jgi:hypothetical protein
MPVVIMAKTRQITAKIDMTLRVTDALAIRVEKP